MYGKWRPCCFPFVSSGPPLHYPCPRLVRSPVSMAPPYLTPKSALIKAGKIGAFCGPLAGVNDDSTFFPIRSTMLIF